VASAGSIFVDLLLRDASYNQGWQRARRTTQSSVGAIGTDIGMLNSKLGGLGRQIQSIGTGFASGLGASQIIKYVDTYRLLEGRLRIVTDSTEDLANKQAKLFQIAQETRQPLREITNTYARLAQFIPEAERSQFDLLGVTKNLATSLAITGETSLSANAALVQFTQAIGTNFEAAGQELRSLQEQAPRLTKALQNALGDGTKSLQQLKAEGLLTRQSVLNALSGTGEEGRKLAKELARIPVTFGQALTTLDNSLTDFFGQSILARESVSALADGVIILGKNLDLIAQVGLTVASVYGIRVAASFAFATQQAVAYQIALARMAGVSALAATGITATTSALSLFGGPAGLAITAASAAMIYFATQTSAAEKAVMSLNEIETQSIDIKSQLAKATAKEAELIEVKLRRQRAVISGNIKEAESELAILNVRARAGGLFTDSIDKAQIENLKSLGKLFKARNELDETINKIKSKDFGKGSSFDQEQKVIDGVFGKQSGSTNTNDVKATKQNRQADELNRILESRGRLIRGVSQEQESYNELVEDLNKLVKAGKITEQERFDAINQYMEENKEKATEWGESLEAITRRAAENMQDAFADFLFDPFADGMDGMLKKFVDTLRQMLAQQTSRELFGMILGSGGAGGLLGTVAGSPMTGGAQGPTQGSGILGAITGGLGDLFDGFFADGGYIQPGHWGVAGEAGAEMVYGGKIGATIVPGSKGGGNVYNIDARGADQGAVVRLEQALLTLAGPGVVEQRVISAQQRGQL
jgi:tape measure domain-containing protein